MRPAGLWFLIAAVVLPLNAGAQSALDDLQRQINEAKQHAASQPALPSATQQATARQAAGARAAAQAKLKHDGAAKEAARQAAAQQQEDAQQQAARAQAERQATEAARQAEISRHQAILNSLAGRWNYLAHMSFGVISEKYDLSVDAQSGEICYKALFRQEMLDSPVRTDGCSKTLDFRSRNVVLAKGIGTTEGIFVWVHGNQVCASPNDPANYSGDTACIWGTLDRE